MCLKYLFNVIP